MVVAPVKPGDILAEKYCVERVLGVGGMGVVVAAEHMALHQKVALKFMLPEVLANESAVERFMREARAAVRLQSEHVARVMDVGCLENGAPYIVMEFLEGEDLSDLIHREGRMPVAFAIDLVLQACLAMAEAHSIGIVHRDLKPANLFITKRPDGTPMVKVLDFGISKVQGGPEEEHQTKSSVSMGSPGYMAPEQMRSAKHADHRADIWALGVILYLLLCNRRPFEAESSPLMFAAVLTGEMTPLSSELPEVDPALEAVVHRCLERDRDARFSTVGELAQALVPFGDARAAAMAASIANISVATPMAALESGANARATMPHRKQAPPSEESAAQELSNTHRAHGRRPNKSADHELPKTHLADATPAKPAANFDKKVLTTHRASAGQVAVAAPEDDFYEPAKRSPLALVVGLVAVAGVAIVGTKVFSSTSSPSAPAAVVQPEVQGAATPPVAPIDAGLADAMVPSAVPDAAPEPGVPRSKKRPKQPTRPKDPTPTPKPKPKPKPKDDPFGTMQ